jgi:hypothetical protein
MRFATSLFLGLIAAAPLCSPAYSQDDADRSLQLYAVHVIRVPKENWTGGGVYLGNGLVVTAAHVAGNRFFHQIRVGIAGQELAATVIKEGHFSQVDPTAIDLALVSIDEQALPVSLRLRRMPVCKNQPLPGEHVIVATPEAIARSQVISPALLPHNLLAKFTTAISDVATTGNSGSGVFDQNRQCLLGIISAKITMTRIRQANANPVKEAHDIAKYFVPAPVITEFIPPQYHY